MPQTDSIRKAVWTNWNDPSESYIDAIVGGTEPQSAIATSCSLKVSIESVPLGSLVPTKNPKPWEYDDSLPEPNESTWQHVTLTIERDDGATVDVELLRPSTWIEQNGLTANQRLPIHIPELEVSGLATVHSVESCPTLAVGEGSFVTGRFVTRRVEQTSELELEDGSTIEGTPIHPVWSLDRNDWTPFGDLQDGELLQSEFGPIAVTKRRVHNKPTAVYNIEVHGEHVYQIGELGLLVHNACNIAANRATGLAGEAAAGITAAKKGIASVLKPGTLRFPDELTGSVLREVKNVAYQHLSTQIRDYLKIAAQTGRQVVLVVRSNTTLSRKLLALEKVGQIVIDRSL